jgi:hypothetical protein
MTADREAVIERIRKLLERRVDRGCTEAEAAKAAELVERMLLDYGLSLADVGERSEVGGIQSAVSLIAGEHESWLASLVASVCDLCMVRSLTRADDGIRAFAWIGEEIDAKAAEMLFVFLVENGRRACLESTTRHRYRPQMFARDDSGDVVRVDAPMPEYTDLPAEYRRSFLVGYVSAIRRRVVERVREREGQSDSTALVRSRHNAAESYALALVGNGRVKEYQHRRQDDIDFWAAYAGQIAGTRTAIGTEKALAG